MARQTTGGIGMVLARPHYSRDTPASLLQFTPSSQSAAARPTHTAARLPRTAPRQPAPPQSVGSHVHVGSHVLGGHVRDERARVVRALRHVIKRVELCAAPLAAAAAAAARRGGRVADNDQAVAQFSMSLL